jgi:hypothetical protein
MSLIEFILLVVIVAAATRMALPGGDLAVVAMARTSWLLFAEGSGLVCSRRTVGIGVLRRCVGAGVGLLVWCEMSRLELLRLAAMCGVCF